MSHNILYSKMITAPVATMDATNDNIVDHTRWLKCREEDDGYEDYVPIKKRKAAMKEKLVSDRRALVLAFASSPRQKERRDEAERVMRERLAEERPWGGCAV